MTYIFAVFFFNALALWMFILSHKLIFSYFLCVHTFHEQPDGIILVNVHFSFFKCRAPVLVRERWEAKEAKGIVQDRTQFLKLYLSVNYYKLICYTSPRAGALCEVLTALTAEPNWVLSFLVLCYFCGPNSKRVSHSTKNYSALHQKTIQPVHQIAIKGIHWLNTTDWKLNF